MNKVNIKIKILLLVLFIGVAVWFNHSLLLDVNQIREWIVTFGMFAPFIFILLYTVRPLLLFPASILSITGGIAFGALMGTIYTIIGATLGAVLSFTIARKLGKNIANKKWKGNSKKIQDQLERNGFLFVLLFRLLPFINFDLISYLAGISKVRMSSFFFGTLIGILPGTFAYNFLGSGIISGKPTIFVGSLLVFFVLTIVPILIRKQVRNKSDIEINGEKDSNRKK